MKWYVKLELILEFDAENYMEAEYQVEDVIDELKAWNPIPKFTRIEETWIDALSFDEWIEEWSPY